MEILKVEGLTKYFTKKSVFRSKTTVVKAVDNISFSLKKGEVFVLAGESGSGKSTTARLILKAIDADSGKIFFNGEQITDDPKSIKKLRMSCQMIYQDPYDSINPRMRVHDIVCEPLEIHGIGSVEERKKMVLESLREVRLEPAEEIVKKYPHTLSGGQRQRVVLARALVLKPKIIIADEPVSMLQRVPGRREVLAKVAVEDLLVRGRAQVGRPLEPLGRLASCDRNVRDPTYAGRLDAIEPGNRP